MRFSLILLVVFLLPACTPNGNVTDSGDFREETGLADDETRRAQLETQILDLIGDAPATAPNQCQTIAFGSKPCGGPWRYLVYSASHTDPDQLGALVKKYNALDEKINIAKGLASDCALAQQPTVTLNGGQCQAAQ